MDYLVALIIFIVVVLALATFLIGIYNTIVRLRNNVDQAFSNIDVVLKQRADEIPNISKVVKATALNENTVLRDLVALRSQYGGAVDADSKVKIAQQMDAKLKTFMLQVEAYPEITATASYIQLQQRLSQLEDKIASRREFFNSTVNLYNNGIQIFPNNIFASLFNFKKRSLLEIGKSEMDYRGVDI